MLRFTSAAVVSDGSYGVPIGLISSFPIRVNAEGWSIADELDIEPFARKKIDASVRELEEERDVVKDLLG